MAYKVLNTKEREEVSSRLEGGESIPALAKEYGVSYNTIKNLKITLESPKVVKAATAIVESRKAQDQVTQLFADLSPEQRSTALRLADHLPGIVQDQINASAMNAKTSYKMAYMANIQSSKIDENDPNPEAVRLVHGLIETSNKAAYQPLELLKASKGMDTPQDDTPKTTLDVTTLSSNTRRELLEARGTD